MNMLQFFRKLFGGDYPSKFDPPDPAPSKSFRDALITVAREVAAENIRETSQNQGPGIEKFWRTTSYGIQGYKNREPWCAAVLCYIFKEAAFRHFGLPPYSFQLPKSARVLDWVKWAGANSTHWRLLSPEKTAVKKGDIILYDFNGPKASGTHIALALSDQKKNGIFDTFEGNTNAIGSREGNGAYIKSTRTRKMAIAIVRYV